MFDIYVIESESLMVGRLGGVLDAKMAGEILDFIEVKEAAETKGFNRFCDLTKLDEIRLSSGDVLSLAVRRRAFNPNDIHVKSAFLATDPLAFGIARMYEQMLNSPRIEVRVWSDLASAAEWLGVSTSTLTG